MRPASPNTSRLWACPRRSRESRDRAPAPDALLRLMAQDKKVKGGRLALVLARGMGQAFVERDVSMPQLTEFLARACA